MTSVYDVSICRQVAIMGGVGRWEPNAQGRLAAAALELFLERGFDEATVAEIAERAGVTERTFYRHFADKREVLFGGSGLSDLMTSAVIDAPPSATPIDAVAAALEATATVFDEARRTFARRRHAVISASPELQERELVKLASLAVDIRAALHRRGVNEPAATLAAEAGMTVFRIAFGHWVDESEHRDLRRLLRAALKDLRSLLATS
jgi:AcrR family transcriptional regulator